MRVIYADTGYWVARLDRQDRLASKALVVAAAVQPALFVTSTFVIAEVGNYFANRLFDGSRQSVGDLFYDTANRPNYKLLHPNESDISDAMKLYVQYSDKQWSFVDCISFILMRQLEITDALAHDHHFEQAEFNALLR